MRHPLPLAPPRQGWIPNYGYNKYLSLKCIPRRVDTQRHAAPRYRVGNPRSHRPSVCAGEAVKGKAAPDECAGISEVFTARAGFAKSVRGRARGGSADSSMTLRRNLFNGPYEPDSLAEQGKHHARTQRERGNRSESCWESLEVAVRGLCSQPTPAYYRIFLTGKNYMGAPFTACHLRKYEGRVRKLCVRRPQVMRAVLGKRQCGCPRVMRGNPCAAAELSTGLCMTSARYAWITHPGKCPPIMRGIPRFAAHNTRTRRPRIYPAASDYDDLARGESSFTARITRGRRLSTVRKLCVITRSASARYA